MSPRKPHKQSLTRPSFDIYQNDPANAKRINDENYDYYESRLEQYESRNRRVEQNLVYAQGRIHRQRKSGCYLLLTAIVVIMVVFVASQITPAWTLLWGIGGVLILVLSFFIGRS